MKKTSFKNLHFGFVYNIFCESNFIFRSCSHIHQKQTYIILFYILDHFHEKKRKRKKKR